LLSETFVRRVEQVFKTAVTACALAAVAACAFVIFKRIAYPYGLEWCESLMLHAVGRVLEGQNLYVKPSVEYASIEYTPLYVYASAAASLLTGPGFLPLRLVSLGATLAVIALIYLFVRKETGNRWFALIAIGLFAALYGHVQGWFDLARIDMLFLAFLAGAVYVLRFHPEGCWSAVTAGFLFFLSWFTKQSVSFMILPLLAYLMLIRPRQALTTIAVFGGSIAAAVLAYNFWTGGWFWFYTFELLTQQKLTPEHWLGFWKKDVFGSTAILVAASVVSGFRGPRSDKGRFFCLFLLAGLLAGCWMSRLHWGSGINSLLPVYVFCIIGFVVWSHEVLKQSAGLSPNRSLPCLVLVFSLLLGQFYSLRYHCNTYIPTEHARRQGNALVDLIASIEGDVFMPAETSLPYFAGKPQYADHVLMLDLFQGTDTAKINELHDQLRQTFQSGRISAIIMTNERPYIALFKDYYVKLQCGLIESAAYQIYVKKEIEPTLGKRLSAVLPIKFDQRREKLHEQSGQANPPEQDFQSSVE